MATAAEPQPAQLPIAGGQEGATVKLHPLLSGECIGPPAWFHREEGRLAGLKAMGIGVKRDQWVAVPIVSFLVEHPGAGPLLVDTGLHPSVAVRPRDNLGRIGSILLKNVRMEPDQAVAPQLRKRGVDPDEVRTVVMTHLHFDHASGISEFPRATFVMDGREWAAATGSRPELRGYVRSQLDHGFDYRLLDFEGPEADSFATFGRSFDLLGDGSVRLVATPGHTHGHLSVVVRLSGGEALIAGDAIYSHRTLDAGHLPARMEDEHLFERSLREIQLYRERTPSALIIPGHDMPAWRQLRGVYE